MSNIGNAVKSTYMTHFDTAAITGDYQPLYETGLDEACFMIRIENASNVNILISFDGITDHEYLALGDSLSLPVQVLSLPSGQVSKFRKGTKVYIKDPHPKLPGTGNIYFIGYY